MKFLFIKKTRKKISMCVQVFIYLKRNEKYICYKHNTWTGLDLEGCNESASAYVQQLEGGRERECEYGCVVPKTMDGWMEARKGERSR